MGGSFSAPPTPIKNKELLGSILTQMFKRADFVDLYALADPEKCKSYIIVGANALEDMFIKMKVYPTKKDDGTLYFQKISSLQGGLPLDARDIQKKHCKELAFFFVRIFQTFGALFLSMYDSEFPTADPSDEVSRSYRARDDKEPLTGQRLFGEAAKPKPIPTAKPSTSSWFGFGGALPGGGSYVLTYDGEDRDIQAMYRDTLNKYLHVPSGDSNYFRLGNMVRVPKGSLPSSGSIGSDFRSVKGIQYVFSRENIEYTLSANLLIERADRYTDRRDDRRYRDDYSRNEYEVILTSFKWPNESPRREPDVRAFVRQNSDGLVTDADNRGHQFDTVVNELFKKHLHSTGIPASVRGSERSHSYSRELGLYPPHDSNSIPEGLRIKGMWTAMVKIPPIKAHCVARASQLLSTQALRGSFTGPAFTSVCRLKFLHQQDGALPKPNQSIMTSAGISALATLFFDTLHEGSPKLTADKPKWNAFKQQMHRLFELSTVKLPETTEEPLKQIKAIKQDTFEICDKPEVVDKRLLVSPRLARSLYTVTQDLMAQQQAHVQRALNLIFQLFDQDEIQTKNRLVLNEQLYSQGMSRVQEISNSAITLLTEYYKGCESTYHEGMKLIYDTNQAEPLKPVS